MTEAEPDPETLHEPEGPPTPSGRPPRRWRPRTPLGWVVAVVVLLLTLGALIIVGVRYGVLAPQVRLLIEARTDGLKLGRFGRLKLEGIEGDIWRHFTVRRLTISDEKGVWLESNRLTVDWRYGQLLNRKLDVDSIVARDIRVLRRPTFDKGGVSQGLPVSIQIDSAKSRVEMLPAFSGKRGLYDLALSNLTVQRGGGTKLKVGATSVLHPGDFLKADIDLGRKKELLVVADANEARGGAIAGAVGLSPDQPFALTARLTGTTSNGRLALVARSGPMVPVVAQGAWNPDGGAVSARALLGASRLTRFWEKRLGPELRLTVVGKKRPQGLYDFDIRALAQNFQLVAIGPVDPGKRQAIALQTRADLKDVNPFFSIPQMGAGRVTGVTSGTINALKLDQGEVTVWDIQDGTWRLPRVSGPGAATFIDRQLDFKASVAGQGGYGPLDWHTMMVGPSPRATVSGTLFKDGRLLIRSIDAVGKNAKLQGEGTRSILGQLNFKGNLDVISLSGERPGSGGSAKMSWVATQKDEPSPWVIHVEGSGQKFALGEGFKEIDRLIGPSPRFKMEATYLKQVFKVSSVTGTGESAQVQGAGVRAPDGQLNFKGTWSAQGPFGVGPVEITGKMTGTGQITGLFETMKTDLLADFDTLTLPRLTVTKGKLALTLLKAPNGAVVGGIGVNGATEYGPARTKAGFRFAEDGVNLQDIDADLGGVRATGSLALRESSPSSADLMLDIGPGALLSAGQVGGTVKIVDAPGGPRATVKLETRGAALRGSTILFDRASFSADGPLARLPYRVEAKGSWDRSPLNFDGGGQISETKGDWTVSFAGAGQARAAKFSTVEPALIRFGPSETSAQLRLSLGGGAANINARQAGDTVDIRAALQNVDIGFLSEDFAGRFNADLTLQGEGSRLTGSLNAKLDEARSRDASSKLGMDGQVTAVLSDNRMKVGAVVTSNQGLKAVGDFNFTTVASAKPFRIAIARNEPMQGRFEANGEIQPLWDLFLGGERTLGGVVSTKVSLGGTFNDPKISGQATMQGGRFEDYATGLALKNLSVEADLLTDRVLVRNFAAADGKAGSVSGSGRLSLERNGGSDFTLNLKRFRLIDNDTASADATGDVTVTRGGDGRIKIVGALAIDEAQINAAAQLAPNIATLDVVEINRPVSARRQLPPPTQRGIGATLDVRLNAPRRIFVSGRGLDVEMSLNARVTGVTAAPVLDGSARMVRGDYEFAGKRFTFDERGIVQLSTNPNLIRLDLSAVREDPSLTAVVRILGTAAKPEITLTSTPVLPNDEVLSQVLFGRSASQLSPLEAAQLASALTALATGGGFDVIGGLRSLAGLDRLTLAGGGETAVSVAGGKYLTENVYLELGGGGRDGPSAEVDYRVSRRLSIISRLSSEGGAKLAVRWRRDLGDHRSGRPGRR